MNIRSLWNNFITSGETDPKNRDLNLLRFINTSSLVGISSSVIFGALHLVKEIKIIGALELALSFIAAINLAALRKWKNTNIATTVILILMILVLGSLFLSGGIAKTGLFWFFTFPPLAFFMKGKKQGWIWVALLYLLMVAAVPFYLARPDIFAYSLAEIRQLAAGLLAVTLLVYFYEHIRSEQQIALQQKMQENQTINQQLQNDIETYKQAELYIKKQNESLEKIKLAMLNLLEDLKSEKEKIEIDKVKNEALLSSIGEGMIATDNELKLTAINAAAAKMLNLDQKKDIGKKYYELWGVVNERGRRLNQEERPISLALQGKKINTDKLSYARRDGKIIPVFITATPVMLGKKIIGVIDVFRDITEEKNIDRAKTEFASISAHQLRTPLTAIRWSTEMLLAGHEGKLQKKQLAILQNIHASNDRMLKLIDALLNVSRIELSTFAIQPVPTNLVEITESLISELTPSIVKQKIKIEKKFQKNLPNINADPQLTRIIIQNLLTNSIKYTPPKGKITVAIEASEKNINISVADTGYGIPEEQRSKIFTKLFRADNIKNKVADGTGLGLYVVKSIIDHSGGKINFDSEENKGTTFYVSLPRSGMKKKEGTKELLLEEK